MGSRAGKRRAERRAERATAERVPFCSVKKVTMASASPNGALRTRRASLRSRSVRGRDERGMLPGKS